MNADVIIYNLENRKLVLLAELKELTQNFNYNMCDSAVVAGKLSMIDEIIDFLEKDYR